MLPKPASIKAVIVVTTTFGAVFLTVARTVVFLTVFAGLVAGVSALVVLVFMKSGFKCAMALSHLKFCISNTLISVIGLEIDKPLYRIVKSTSWWVCV